MDRERKGADIEAVQEARSLVAAMRNGVEIFDALTVLPRTKTILDLFCQREPADAYIVRNAMEFRERVMHHVQLLLEAGAVVDPCAACEEGTCSVHETDEAFEADIEDDPLAAPSAVAEAARWTIPDRAESPT